MNAGNLRCKIDFYTPTGGENEYGENTLDDLQLVAEGIPAQIIPATGRNPEDGMGGLDGTLITHKMRIRENAVALAPDMVIMYAGQRYELKYWQPVYNNQRFIELMTVMEVAV